MALFILFQISLWVASGHLHNLSVLSLLGDFPPLCFSEPWENWCDLGPLSRELFPPLPVVGGCALYLFSQGPPACAPGLAVLWAAVRAHCLAFYGSSANVLATCASKISITGVSDLGFSIISRMTIHSVSLLVERSFPGKSQSELPYPRKVHSRTPQGPKDWLGSCCASFILLRIRGYGNKT